tara:strand:- start:54 stop:260 length:207 start_codon:yes stop_codon:yes gene_type:complete
MNTLISKAGDSIEERSDELKKEIRELIHEFTSNCPGLGVCVSAYTIHDESVNGNKELVSTNVKVNILI